MSDYVWLASYPKSGSTWFRMLLANLDADRPVDINALRGRGGIASARSRFDEMLLIPSGLLTHDECDRLRPLVYREMARSGSDRTLEDPDAPGLGVRFVKTHDAWTTTTDGEALLGGAAAARAAILIVRDPRDVAPSLASHNDQPIDDATTFMADAAASFCGGTDRQHNQLRQQLPGWSGYHHGWIEQAEVPVHIVRYEDLHADTPGVFARALAFAGVPVDAERIGRAVASAGFEHLARQERELGFREAPAKRREPFFRRGRSGGWREELTDRQARRIEADHAAMMRRLGYEVET